MSVIQNNLLMTPEGYQISRSVRLRSSASAYFNRTPAVASNRTTFTYSGWVKRGALANGYLFTAGTTSTNRFQIDFYNNTLEISMNNGSWVIDMTSSSVYRDPSAWYHVVVAVDTTQATSSNRVKAYINGVQITSWNTSTYPSLNLSTPVNSVVEHDLGISIAAGSYFDGYMTEVNFIDGQALTPSSFGETDAITGVWKPKKYAGTYGTNGFYLNFSDNSNNTAATIGKDYSGNGNNWTPNNISVTAGVTYDSMIDVPTMYADGGNGRGNYAVLSPLDVTATTKPTNGNLTYSPSATSPQVAIATIDIPSTGKWYAEFTKSDSASTSWPVGIIGTGRTDTYTGGTNSIGYWATGQIYKDTSLVQSSLATLASGDVVGVAVDADAKTVQFYKNGSAVGTAVSYTYSQVWFACGNYVSGLVFNANFGQRPFAYTPPTGFKALNTQNLPESTIKKGNQYFDVLTWSGTGGSSRALTGLAFQPDFVWGKVRNTTYGHMLFDAVRGAGSLKELGTNNTSAEGYGSSNQYGYLSAFNSDGFTVTAGTDASIPNAYWNQSGNTYASWQWKESVTAGFDIVTYTGNSTNRTIAHGLGVAPQMIIVKNRSAVYDWPVYHSINGATKYMYLNTTSAASVASSLWNDTAPTSSVFSVGTSGAVNNSSQNYVAYLFAEVAGFSKFGSYTGNGSADGPFVYCGFRPRFIMIKRTDTTSNWVMWDTARDTYNAGGLGLYPNLSAAEDDYRSSNPDDILSNGFKPRANYANVNASGGTYIFMAVAENPFKNSLAR